MSGLRVYLAGCFDKKYPRPGEVPWRDVVRGATSDFVWLDPEDKALPDVGDPAQFFAWDMAAVRTADVVFAYLSEHTPHAHGLAAELGYALALQKPIVLVADPAALENSHYRFMVRCADVVYPRLSDGLTYLCSLAGA